MLPVLSLSLLTTVFVHKKSYILHCLQKAPLFLVLDLALVHSSTPQRAVLYGAYTGEAAVIEREKGLEQREGAAVIFRNMIDIRLILYTPTL